MKAITILLLSVMLMLGSALFAGPTTVVMPGGRNTNTAHEAGTVTVKVPCYASDDTVHAVVSVGPTAGDRLQILEHKALTVASDGNGGWEATFTFDAAADKVYMIETLSPGPDKATKPNQIHFRRCILIMETT